MPDLPIDVNNNLLNQQLADSSSQGTEQNIPPNSQGVTSGNTVELDEGGVPVENRIAEARRKQTKAEDEAVFYKNFAQQQQALTQQSLNRINEVPKQQVEQKENPLLNITDKQLEDYASMSDENAADVNNIRIARDAAREEHQYAKFKQRALVDPDFARQETPTVNPEAVIKTDYPELQDFSSPAFASFKAEYNALAKATGVEGKQLYIAAAENAKLRNPALFPRNKQLDSRETLLNQNSQNSFIPGNRQQPSGQPAALTNEDIATANVMGNDPKLLAQIKSNFKYI